MPNETADAYLRTKVLTAPPEQLRLMLLDGAIRFATQGRDALIRKDFEGVFNGFSQAREIVLELATSVKAEPNPELAAQVRNLYLFIFQQIVSASFQKDPKLASDAIRLLEYERETWVLAVEQAAKERGTNAQACSNPIATIDPSARPTQQSEGQTSSISLQA